MTHTTIGVSEKRLLVRPTVVPNPSHSISPMWSVGPTPSPKRGALDASTVAMVQIEDASALDHLDAIASIKDVDMMFIGPADLSQSMGCGFPSPELDAAIQKIIDAGQRNGMAVGLFVRDAKQIPAWHAKGITLFVCGSDQAMLRKAATQAKAASTA